jgi:DNA mismatch repair protein MutL
MATDRIQLLDENTANRIAAGEVVERPASAVKELVENAIDAGATHIDVDLEEGGKQSIVVTDDGCGMTRTDAILSIQRHATSKIKTAADLFAIHTLGFRGEALPSIASVSHFTLITKPHDDDAGTRLVVEGGDIQEVESTVARDGTTIRIDSLFYNTPARLKFLKSTPSESGKAIEVVGQLAIVHPHVAFRVRSGGHEVFSTPGDGKSLSALASVWGRDTAKKLFPISHENGGLTVTGFVATPDTTRPGRTHELFYVNHRPIRSRLIGHALEDAVRSFTPESRYPIAAIFIAIPPDLVDVNVHPTKAEIKFTRDGEVHHAVSQAVKNALLEYGIVPTASPRITTPGGGATTVSIPPRISRDTLSGSFPSVPFSPAPIPDRSSLDALLAPLGIESAPAPPSDQTALDYSQMNATSEPLQAPPRPRPFAQQLRNFRVLGQARNTYIIAVTADGLAVIDQHVAHERVLYERLTEKRFADGIPVQRLALPVTITLDRREALLLTEHCDSFTDSGWEITPFGGESFILRSVPAMLANKPYESILRDMIDELVNQTVSRRLLVQRDHVTITNACKMAVKAGDPLAIEEMQGLLEQLAETENPYLCPHGRPIVVTIPYSDLDKLFKRT